MMAMRKALRHLCSLALCVVIASAVQWAMPVAMTPHWALSDEAEAAPLPRPARANRLTVGKDLNARPDNTYDPVQGTDISAIERDLNEICPCLFIRIINRFKRSDRADYRAAGNSQNIIIRHPGDVGDLSPNLRNTRNYPSGRRGNRSDAQLQSMSDHFCDCYKRHRAGCNLLWKLANGDTDVVVWRSELGVGNRHRPPHANASDDSNIAYNRNRNRSDVSEPPDSSRHPPTDRRPTSIGLAHELVHAYARQSGNHVDQNRDRTSDNYNEFVAGRGENQIRKEMHDESEARLRPHSDDLSDDAKGDYEKYDNPWPWRSSRDLDRINRRTWPRSIYTDREGHLTIPNRSRAVITTDDLFNCDKKVSYLPPWPADPMQEGYAVAVQTPEECVGTYYTIDQGNATPASAMSISLGPLYATPQDEQTTSTPDGQIPLCTASPTPETPSSPPSQTPEPKQPATTTTATPDRPEKTPAETQTPELGLVKAQESVVELALANSQTGKPIEGASLKLLSPAPDLPGEDQADAAAASLAEYVDDVPAAAVDDSGVLSVKIAGRPGDAGDKAAPQNDRVTRHEISHDTAPVQQLVVAAKSAMTGLPAKLAPKGSKICVSRGFRIGPTPVFVLRVPESDLKSLSDAITASDDISYFEPDQCRDKEHSKAAKRHIVSSICKGERS